MKRTKFPKNSSTELKKYINLVRKITWMFHYSTGIEWNELFSEASLAYCEAINSYTDSKRNKESSWIFICIQNKLKNFCKIEIRNKSIDNNVVKWMEYPSFPEYEYYDKEASPDVLKVISMVLQNPNRYNRLKLTYRTGVGNIRKDLKNKKKWFPNRVDDAMRNLRLELID